MYITVRGQLKLKMALLCLVHGSSSLLQHYSSHFISLFRFLSPSHSICFTHLAPQQKLHYYIVLFCFASHLQKRVLIIYGSCRVACINRYFASTGEEFEFRSSSPCNSPLHDLASRSVSMLRATLSEQLTQSAEPLASLATETSESLSSLTPETSKTLASLSATEPLS